jgi:ERCC4-related helicase
MSGAKVDLNPHQVEAARFALQSPISNGTILADEVGLGKTIEAGLILTQMWAEQKNKILLILPAALLVQWKTELETKFNIPAVIIKKPRKKKGVDITSNPFKQAVDDKQVAICSIDYAAKSEAEISNIMWNLVVIDEAHRLRNVYKGTKKAAAIKKALEGRKKLLLTATPLQNDLKEMYGLTSFIDDHIFGDAKVFNASNIEDIRIRLRPFCKRTLRKDTKQFGLNFTERHVITRKYTPNEDEQKLYKLVSEYLQDETISALPEKGRQLVIMVARKLLASSTFAISKTLNSFQHKLEGIIESCDKDLNDEIIEKFDDELERELAEDYEEFSSYDDELQDEDGDDSIINEVTQQKKSSAEAEIKRLQEMSDLAESITSNAKGDDLLIALEKGFEAVKERKGAKKAVIFTESVRTQNYVFKLLSDRGYEGKIVLLNGSNNDETSKKIYKEWKERHKDDGTITHKAADMKAAIVEEFRDKAEILIGTEAAAEGINLQFCSMIVNYDLPWNPQRVEQRIGRCHRYGQKYDVVVVNFVNQSNAADKRVYELLDKKFKLFESAFGASDAPIGMIEAGTNFDKSILNIYQKCRSDDEINDAFDLLMQKYEEVIISKREETLKYVLESFDENVLKLLKDCADKTKASLDDISRWKFNLFTAYGANRVGDSGWIVELDGHKYIPSWETAKDRLDIEFLTADSPAYLKLLHQAEIESVPTVKIQFNYSSVQQNESNAFLNNHPNLKGTVDIKKLTYNYGIEGELEEHLIISAISEKGEEISSKDINRIMELPGETVSDFANTDTGITAISDRINSETKTEVDLANKENLQCRFAELNSWSLDRETALDREILDLQKELEFKRNEQKSRVAELSWEEILALDSEISELDSKINKKQRQKLDDKEKIKKVADKEKSKAANLIKGEFHITNIMTFSFEIV